MKFYVFFFLFTLIKANVYQFDPELPSPRIYKEDEINRSTMYPFQANTYQLGSDQPSRRIFYGDEVDESNMYPFQAFLNITCLYELRYCSGALISEKFILTAAHCLYKSIRVAAILGTNDLDKISDWNVYEAGSYYIHREWNSLINNDIGLLKLQDSVTFNNQIQPINLPKKFKNEDFTGFEATVAGWGLTEDGVLSTKLLQITSKVLSNKECTKQMPIHIPKSEICLSGDGEKSICSGDSGGPLFINQSNQNYIIGIASYGIIGCGNYFPSVFTRVSFYLEWIAHIMDM